MRRFVLRTTNENEKSSMCYLSCHFQLARDHFSTRSISIIIAHPSSSLPYNQQSNVNSSPFICGLTLWTVTNRNPAMSSRNGTDAPRSASMGEIMCIMLVKIWQLSNWMRNIAGYMVLRRTSQSERKQCSLRTSQLHGTPPNWM